MDIDEYISSGIVETYCLGLSNEDERQEFEHLRTKYPQLQQALEAFEHSLEAHAAENSNRPPASVKFRFLNAMEERRSQDSSRNNVLEIVRVQRPKRSSRLRRPLQQLAAFVQRSGRSFDGLVLRSFELARKCYSGDMPASIQAWFQQALPEQTSLTPRMLWRLAKQPPFMDDLSSAQFEEMVLLLLHFKGYSVARTSATRDGGKDIIIAQHTSLGKLILFVECKQYSKHRKVGVGTLRTLYGVITHEHIPIGVLVTNSYFTADAIQWQQPVQRRLLLINRDILLQWLSDYHKQWDN